MFMIFTLPRTRNRLFALVLGSCFRCEAVDVVLESTTLMESNVKIRNARVLQISFRAI